jgi:hypothetical protein
MDPASSLGSPGHSLNYVIAFAALGVFVSIMALALNLDVAAF